MTICKITGMACDCQPDEGVQCTGEQTLREGFHGWRNAALKAEARVRELVAALASPQPDSPEPVAWRISLSDGRHVVHGHNSIGDYRLIDPKATSTPLYAHPLAATSKEPVARSLWVHDLDGPTETIHAKREPFGEDSEWTEFRQSASKEQP